ncbi:MAG TPA: glutamate synthase-related protein, partial [Bradyrhizobium sp.]|nr:glutamate synthase-related protein [Bradyrhizobium sp.]
MVRRQVPIISQSCCERCDVATRDGRSLGCIQSLSCHTDRCPTGVTTQDPTRARALVVPHKIERVYNYHHATL